MALSTQQREFIIDAIVHSINESQVSDNYDFGELEITWVASMQLYLVEFAQGDLSNDWESPGDIGDLIDSLSDQNLIRYYCNEECINEEDLEEYIDEELEETA